VFHPAHYTPAFHDFDVTTVIQLDTLPCTRRAPPSLPPPGSGSGQKKAEWLRLAEGREGEGENKAGDLRQHEKEEGREKEASSQE
jgi:hypothetical protein